MDDLRITPAGVEDAPLVHHIMRAAFLEYADRLRPPTGALSESVEDVERFLVGGGAILAWLGSTPVGTARYEPSGAGLYVGRVSILPAYRRRGIATALMRHIERESKEEGRAFIKVGVRKSLPGNLALYQSLGYEVVEVRQHPKGPDQVVWLEKALP